MILDSDWIIIVFIALVVDFIIGEFPIKHPVEFMGDYVKYFEKIAYKDSVKSGMWLLVSLISIVGLVSIIIQFILPAILVGIIASTGLASKSLQTHIKNVLFEENDEKKREKLAGLVTRNTRILDDKKVYASLIETHSENLADGFISPLFYLILFGLPGIMVFKAVSTLDSMVGYKNEKYYNFGKVSAIADDVLNFIPARLTGLIIWLMSKHKILLKKLFEDAKKYSSSPNAGYPVAAAAYAVGVQVGGTVYYGDMQVDKAEIGHEITHDYKEAAFNFLKIHLKIEVIILILVTIGVVLAL